MIDFSDFFQRLELYKLGKHRTHFQDAIDQGMSTQRHGHLNEWLAVLDSLPQLKAKHQNLTKSVTIGQASELEHSELNAINTAFRSLIPWRKGPFNIFGLDIDTEWRSDWKWDRVLPHLDSLRGRKILDVGCGSGYHCLRMAGEQASWVLGIDPSPRFVVQFAMLKHFLHTLAADVLPLGIEHIPPHLQSFDTCFSMGILYHRTSPIDHLKELRGTLRPGGQLVLETLVIEGKLGESLVPKDRYAMMRNVWFIPSVATLSNWLEKCGFCNIRCVDLNKTRVEEQRSTEWMPSFSLKDFLDPNEPSKTIEGYPAPLRAIIIAERPE